jgi:protein tyrosine phosphatase (PTP) superfamily phosphohydrolase (DUF442 family)
MRLSAIAALKFAIVAASYVYWTNNFHVIQSGAAYRSAQPSARELADYARDYGIRSVINLRGGAQAESWYDEEHGAAAHAGIAIYDFPLSAKRRLTANETQRLVATLVDAPKPILIHCKHGVDRCGLVSALYLFAVAHQSSVIAANQLGAWYGHLPYFGNATVAIDEAYWSFVKAHSNDGADSSDRNALSAGSP